MHTFLSPYKLIYMLTCIISMIMISCWTDWITISSLLCRCHRHITPLSFIHVNSDKTYLNIQTLKIGRPPYDSHDEIISPIHPYSFTQPIAPDKTREVKVGLGTSNSSLRIYYCRWCDGVGVVYCLWHFVVPSLIQTCILSAQSRRAHLSFLYPSAAIVNGANHSLLRLGRWFPWQKPISPLHYHNINIPVA